MKLLEIKFFPQCQETNKLLFLLHVWFALLLDWRNRFAIFKIKPIRFDNKITLLFLFTVGMSCMENNCK